MLSEHLFSTTTKSVSQPSPSPIFYPGLYLTMSPLKEVTNNDKPVQKAVGKTKGKVGRPPKAAGTPVATPKVKPESSDVNKAPNFHEDEDELVAQACIREPDHVKTGLESKLT